MGNHKSNKKISGFSLVEMAVVLVIAGLILGTVISAMNTQVTGQRLKSNIERQHVIKQALTNYLARNFHLPCPADPRDQTSPGLSQPSGAACLNVLATTGSAPDIAYIGAVPWLDLGLSEEAVTDAYGRRFTYAVSYSAVGLNMNTVSGMTGNMVVYATATPAFANPLNACTATSPCEKFAVAVIVSHGSNGFGAYYGVATPMGTTGATADELANADNADRSFVVRDFSQNGFDDTVLWLKPDDLLTPLLESGVIKHATGYTVGEIQKATIDYIIATRDTDLCDAGANPGNAIPSNASPGISLARSDAWARPLNLISDAFNICASSAIPASTAFTIRSAGIDGTLGTGDDYVTSITQGEVLNLLARLGF